MAFFNRDNRSGGRRSFGGRRDFGGRGGGDRQMHKAICSNCGRECEVPFKPTGQKPVYCSDCFEKFGRDSSPRRFEDRGQRRSDFEQKGSRPQNNDQFNELNSKLDKIIYLLQSQIPKKPEETIPDIGVEEIIKMPNPPADEPVLSPKKKTKKSKKRISLTPEETSSSINDS